MLIKLGTLGLRSWIDFIQRECLCFYVDFSENISSLIIVYHRIFLFKGLFGLTRFSLF